MDKPKVLIGHQLIDLLQQYDVDTVFGIPGVHTIELYRGLKHSSIRHITPRHEQGAGFMADGYARATGKVGVCLCITGPGMTNIATPMGQAFADSIPMLVISSVNPTDTLGLGTGRLHELKNQQQMMSGVCAFSHTLLSINELPDVMAWAFAVFTSARPRPVHIEIPTNLMSIGITKTAPKKFSVPSKPGPDAKVIDHIIQKLSQSKKGALLVGGGCVNAEEALQRFVELTGMPTCLTINARGLLPPEHPLLLDGVQTTTEFRDYISECDICIAIGTELGETDYDFYSEGPMVHGGDLIRIDIDPAQLHTNGIASIGLLSDADLALLALCHAIERNNKITKQSDAASTVSVINQAMRHKFSKATTQYETLLSEITNTDPNTIIVGDSTKPIYHANFMHRAPRPRHWFNSATGYGTLGYALPAAIGAKLGRSEATVVAIAGDGGFQFTLNELMVATQNSVTLAIIIWNNSGYKEINDFMVNNNIASVGVNVQGPNLELLAKSMHANYAKALALSDISTHLKTLATLSGPLVIEYVPSQDA